MNHQEKTDKGLEACISQLLKGERDEQRLAGLLLSTKFCNADDHASILRVYDAIGVQFLDRLLMTGIGKGDTIGDNLRENQDSYLLLSVTIFSGLCRVPEIAASKHMVSRVPIMLEILQKRDVSPSVYNECYEILFLVSTASADGLTTLYESKGMIVLASHMPSLPDGSHTLELAIRLLQLMLSKLPLEITNIGYPSELSCVVMTLARQFALSHNVLKFEVLHLLSAILSSRYSAPVLDALRLMSNDDWTTFIRVGIVAVLQNRVASPEKLQALVLAESVISIVGESWLIDHKNLLHETEPIPVDRCLLLVLESSRVEVAVLLNDLAYLKYEASKDSSALVDSIILKQRNLGIAFSLIEKIIKLISSSCEDEGNSTISESTLMKVITGLNETIGLVLDFLQDAKDHGLTKGDDLLASVRIIGSYLAETPFACKEKVQSLLEHLLSITGEDELSPFYSVCFLLPMLCQITMETEGCMMLASFDGQKPVVECLIKMIGPRGPQSEDSATIFLACDTIMNLLLKRREIPFQLDGYNFVHLLGALACWTEDGNDQSAVMMASSICSLIFESTSEEALLTHPNFDLSTLNNLSRLIVRSLGSCGKEMSDDANADRDLHQIVSTGYARWADKFPNIKQAVQSMKHQL